MHRDRSATSRRIKFSRKQRVIHADIGCMLITPSKRQHYQAKRVVRVNLEVQRRQELPQDRIRPKNVLWNVEMMTIAPNKQINNRLLIL
jgi:hypothetical protein